MSESEDTIFQVTERRKRYTRRVSEPRWPFAPYGLLPALGLVFVFWVALFPFARGVIQQSTERAASKALISTGANWARARVSGQWVTLEGDPPTQGDALRALSAVRSVKSSTIFGGFTPATRVRTNFQSATSTDTDFVDPADIENADWQFRLSEGILRLSGRVPTEADREAIADTARTKLDPPRIVAIDNDLKISGKPAAEGYILTALRGINTLGQCDRGLATLRSEVFSLNCEVPKDREAPVTALASARLPFGTPGDIDVLPNEEVSLCEEAMETILKTARIEFSTGSARIRPTNEALLDNIAETAKDCPGRLRIEGHTDNTGGNAKNEELSGQRAEAVKQALARRGVPLDRLVAEGFGAESPISPNATLDGRARNRRIEIRVVRTPR